MIDDPRIGNGNRLTVFVLSSAEDVRAIMNDKIRGIDGFHTGRVTGSLAYFNGPLNRTPKTGR
jgi:hypothetical protein